MNQYKENDLKVLDCWISIVVILLIVGFSYFIKINLIIILILIPLIYGLTIPIFIKQMIPRDALYYYVSYSFFLLLGTIINLIIYSYAILNMNIIKWGKTRATSNDDNNNNDNDNNSDTNENIEINRDIVTIIV